MNILMVCLGNICRSPIAEGIMRDLIAKNNLSWSVDSAGTSGYHNGAQPDLRSIDVARQYGIDLTSQQSRKFIPEDFKKFDLIYVMDTSNYRNVIGLAKSQSQKDKVKLLLNEVNPGVNQSVPDPYYEGGFEGVFKMIEEACHAVVAKSKSVVRV